MLSSHRRVLIMSALALTVAVIFVGLAVSYFLFRSSSSKLVSLGEGSNNQTINVYIGEEVKVSLNSTYWTFKGSSDSAILTQQGQAQTSLDPNVVRCIAGSGCGILSLSFKAERSGTAVISATRTTCGEALLCTTDAQKSYKVTIVIK
jgi:hypothetical protein